MNAHANFAAQGFGAFEDANFEFVPCSLHCHIALLNPVQHVIEGEGKDTDLVGSGTGGAKRIILLLETLPAS